MIDAPLPLTTSEHVLGGEKNREALYPIIQRQLLETSFIFASFLDVVHFARIRGWRHIKYPELDRLFTFFEIPHDAFTLDGISAFTHVAVDHYADILRATHRSSRVNTAHIPQRLQKIAPHFAESVQTDLIRTVTRPHTHLTDVRRSLWSDPTGASWLEHQVTIDERIEPPTLPQKVMTHAAITGARKLFTA